MYVDAYDISLAPHLILDGYWEDWITAEVQKHVTPGMKIVEVGANVGYYTLLMADGVGPSGQLMTFEAAPDMAELLRSNVAVNGYRDRVLIYDMAACDQSAPQTFYRCHAYKGGSSLFDITAAADALRDDVEVINVPGVRLDDMVKWPRIDFMKIDAEGAEARILKGAKETIDRSPDLKIILEFTSNQREIGDLLVEHGFHLAPILPGKPTRFLSLDALLQAGPCDILAVRKV